MSQATLNFVEADLVPDTIVYDLYTRLLEGMRKANEVEAPAFPSSEDLMVRDGEGHPTFDDDGNPIIDSQKEQEIQTKAAEYSEILMKNSAYLFASSIDSIFSGEGSSGSSTGFVMRGGDSMTGSLQAWYGFTAGAGGMKVFEVEVSSTDSQKSATVDGILNVTEDLVLTGILELGDGISFDGNNIIYYGQGVLNIDNDDIKLTGDIEVDGTFTLGDVLINNTGIYWGDKEFYHSGNCNMATVDWTMKDANVYGDLTVYGDVSVNGAFEALHGFRLGDTGKALLFSERVDTLDDNGDPLSYAWVKLDSNLQITSSHGIQIGNDYVLKPRNADVLSFSAPGKTLNLGDDDGGNPTLRLSLQADLYDYSCSNKIISKEGAGFFPNGLAAQTATTGSEVLTTYYTDSSDFGVLFPKFIRLGNQASGPVLTHDLITGGLETILVYTNNQGSGTTAEALAFDAYFAQTTSQYRDHSLPWSATLHFNTEGEFFCFDQPVESEFFAVNNDFYSTRLIANALFFDDGKFIEGVTDGLRYAGNGYFDGNISSPSFASGFAGYGWAVKEDITDGGFHATFDTLTVRKKMRVYELEVQKISCTNGSLWVSDFCSGDEVIELV